MGTWVDEMHRKQDERLQAMVEMWRKDERLKPFDLYFRWKAGEITTAEWRNSRDAIRQMRRDTKRVLNELWEHDETGQDPLESVVDYIDDELINIAMILGL